MSKGYCNIQGRGLKFCQGSIGELKQKFENLTPEQVNAWGAHWLVYFGLVGNCTVKGEDVNFTFEETVDWYESLSEEEGMQILNAYNETQKFAEALPKVDETKKKPAKKKP